MTRDHHDQTPPSPFVTGIKCRCPRCGQGALFAAPFNLALQPACRNCGLDYKFIDTGDGPAVFVIMILGFLILGSALVLEFSVHPPIWVHMVVWTPLTLLLALGLLRPLKATLVSLQYVHKAGQGRRAADEF